MLPEAIVIAAAAVEVAQRLEPVFTLASGVVASRIANAMDRSAAAGRATRASS